MKPTKFQPNKSESGEKWAEVKSMMGFGNYAYEQEKTWEIVVGPINHCSIEAQLDSHE